MMSKVVKSICLAVSDTKLKRDTTSGEKYRKYINSKSISNQALKHTIKLNTKCNLLQITDVSSLFFTQS